jgi:hypothetical protein
MHWKASDQRFSKFETDTKRLTENNRRKKFQNSDFETLDVQVGLGRGGGGFREYFRKLPDEAGFRRALRPPCAPF